MSAPPFPRTQHALIYADPAWKYDMFSEKGEAKSPNAKYDTMSLEELLAMRDDVIFATAPHAVCVMWVTFPKLHEGMALMKGWGFQYKTGGPWIKRAGTGNPNMGTGYIMRGAAELFLIGTLGQPTIKERSKSQRNVLLTGEWPKRIEDIDSVMLDTQIREHSRKPEEMVEIIEALFDGPYLELFARNRRPGWTSWGNQLDKFSTEGETNAKAN